MLIDDNIRNLMKELIVTELETQLKLARARARAIDTVEQYVDDESTKSKEHNDEIKLVMQFASKTPSVVSHAFRALAHLDSAAQTPIEQHQPHHLQHSA